MIRTTITETTEDDETRFPVSVPPYEPYNSNQIWYSQPYYGTTSGLDVGKPVEKSN